MQIDGDKREKKSKVVSSAQCDSETDETTISPRELPSWGERKSSLEEQNLTVNPKTELQNWHRLSWWQRHWSVGVVAMGWSATLLGKITGLLWALLKKGFMVCKARNVLLNKLHDELKRNPGQSEKLLTQPQVSVDDAFWCWNVTAPNTIQGVFDQHSRHSHHRVLSLRRQ